MAKQPQQKPPYYVSLTTLLLSAMVLAIILACGGASAPDIGVESESEQSAPASAANEAADETAAGAAAEGEIDRADSSDSDISAQGEPSPAATAPLAPAADAAEEAVEEESFAADAAEETMEEPAEEMAGVADGEADPGSDESFAAEGDSDSIVGDDSLPEGGASAPAPAPRSQGAPAPLKAGEIDDNADFVAYLDYLASFQGSRVRFADVSERYFITVLGDEQQPLMDAEVRIFDEQGQELFMGRTYAGGTTLFLPGVRDVSPNVQRFEVVAEYGNSRTETILERYDQERVELALSAATPSRELQLDLLFLLDTTGSMGDELARIQDTIDSIAQRIDSFQPRPDVRFGLVAYRDEGDAYVTRDYDFTADVGDFRAELATYEADGGGDTPEALDEGLHNAIHDLQWRDNAVRLIFLVADAGPQTSRDLGYNYLSDAQQAVAQGIKLYPIAASNTDSDAEYVFRQLAQQTLASFIFLTYQPGESSGAPGESTELAAGEQAYTVERLDDLIVQLVERELAAAVGAR